LFRQSLTVSKEEEEEEEENKRKGKEISRR
jgi:hypothetical protein